MDHHDDLAFRRRPSGLYKPPVRRQTSSNNDSSPPLPPRPTTSAGSNSRPNLRLKPVRSATNLRAAHAAPSIPSLPDRSHLPVGFVIDESISPTTPNTPSSLIPPLAAPNLRRARSSSSAVPSSHGSLTKTLSTSSTQAPTIKEQSKWKAALGEAQYFAGGLISKPSESTRHYTIIRHSHALVWYRGPSTSVAITILSDTSIPHDRSIWLQQKGYSGNVGMSLKALVGTTSSWIDVTPATQARVDQIAETDERGYQRDLRRFEKKATGRARKHVPKETLIVRIPASAKDGYFRLVVCTGGRNGDDAKRVVLCGCPVFRVASTSTDAAVVRGASLKTMPLEVGVKVGTFVGRQYANKYVGVVGAVAQSKAGKAVPKLKKVSTMGRTAYREYQGSQLSERVNDSWNRGKLGRYDSLTHGMEDGVVTMREGEEDAVGVIGSDRGPEAPFPVKFDGRVGRGTGSSSAEYGFPTANLREVTDAVKMRMTGVFAAWVMILPGTRLPDVCDEWYEAVVTIAPSRDNTQAEVVPKNKIRVHIIRDFDDGTTFFDAKVKVMLMGFLHPPLAKEVPTEVYLEQHMEDTITTLASLSRESWSPHGTLVRMKTLNGERSLSERLDSVTGKVQRGVDRLPLHLAGIRSESSEMRDQTYGIGGFWVRR